MGPVIRNTSQLTRSPTGRPSRRTSRALPAGSPSRAEAGPIDEPRKRDSLQSITAALRMQTIVAWPGIAARRSGRCGGGRSGAQRLARLARAATTPPTSTSNSPSMTDRHSTDPRWCASESSTPPGSAVDVVPLQPLDGLDPADDRRAAPCRPPRPGSACRAREVFSMNGSSSPLASTRSIETSSA